MMKREIVLSVFLSTASLCAFGQGYIQLKQKSLSEDLTQNFTYTFSGSPPAISDKVLTDQETNIRRIYDLAGDADGGLFAIANNTLDGDAGTTRAPLYYRAANSTQWEQITGFSNNSRVFAVDGGAGGGFIAIVRSGSSNNGAAGSGDQVWYRPNSTGLTDITRNSPGRQGRFRVNAS